MIVLQTLYTKQAFNVCDQHQQPSMQGSVIAAVVAEAVRRSQIIAKFLHLIL